MMPDFVYRSFVHVERNDPFERIIPLYFRNDNFVHWPFRSFPPLNEINLNKIKYVYFVHSFTLKGSYFVERNTSSLKDRPCYSQATNEGRETISLACRSPKKRQGPAPWREPGRAWKNKLTLHNRHFRDETGRDNLITGNGITETLTYPAVYKVPRRGCASYVLPTPEYLPTHSCRLSSLAPPPSPPDPCRLTALTVRAKGTPSLPPVRFLLNIRDVACGVRQNQKQF